MTATARMTQAEHRAKPRPTPDTPAEHEARALRASGASVWPKADERGSAYHEAGHSVAMVLLGVPILSAVIGTDGTEGFVRAGAADALRRLCYAVAGGVAQAYAERCSSPVGEPWRNYSTSDKHVIHAAVRELEGRARRDWGQSQQYRNAVRWATQITTTHSGDLMRVAYLLSEYRVLSGRAVALACGR